jgi:hypothetical protein
LFTDRVERTLEDVHQFMIEDVVKKRGDESCGMEL